MKFSFVIITSVVIYPANSVDLLNQKFMFKNFFIFKNEFINYIYFKIKMSYIDNYIFGSDYIIKDLRLIILEYWMTKDFLYYLNIWAMNPQFYNNIPIWTKDKKEVSIIYIKPQRIDESLVCYELSDEPFDDLLKKLLDETYDISHDKSCERYNLFINIACIIHINQEKESIDRNYMEQRFIPIECISVYNIERTGNNDEYIKLNINKLITNHVWKCDLFDINDFDSLKTFTLELKKLKQLSLKYKNF